MSGNGKWANLSCSTTADGTVSFDAQTRDAGMAQELKGKQAPDGTIEGTITISSNNSIGTVGSDGRATGNMSAKPEDAKEMVTNAGNAAVSACKLLTPGM